jgi:Ran GTPase-activating protein 1
MASTKVFSLEGKGLKLDTAEDLEPHIADLRANDVEEVRLLGNTLGVGACKLLGEVLATKKNLKVRQELKCRDFITFEQDH